MRRVYRGHDGFIGFSSFNKWVLSAEGAKRIYRRVSPSLATTSIYRFQDATITYFESGDHKDAAPVKITVEGDTESLVKAICGTIDRYFPRLERRV